jgi:macrolide-specific efflux system membrane fusion protein
MGPALLALLLVTQTPAAEPIEIDAVLLTPVLEVEVPALEAGALQQVAVSEGAVLAQGDLIAQLDDSDARLQRSQAELELHNARRNAGNDINVRVSEKAAAVASAELQRGLDSRERYPKSVSETELDRLRLAAEHAQLQIEQARYELETARLTVQLAENALQQAERQVQRRRITAPAPGRVVQLFRRQGEWVEPGQTVVRILRIDRLRAVGFLNAAQLTTDLAGRRATFYPDTPVGDAGAFPGAVAFVQSEVNAVSGQVDFWAEIENDGLLLRPGLRGRLVIDTAADE